MKVGPTSFVDAVSMSDNGIQLPLATVDGYINYNRAISKCGLGLHKTLDYNYYIKVACFFGLVLWI